MLLALILVVTGLYLWWPRNWRILKSWRGFKTRFAVRTNGTRKRLNYDMHNVLGFYMAVPLFLMAITGAYFIYYDEIQSTLDKITFSEQREDADWTENIRNTAPPGEEPLTVYEALDLMEELYPQYLRRNM